MQFLQSLSPNFTNVNVILVLMGMLIYFIAYFKTKLIKEKFSIFIWGKENWYNIVISFPCIIVYFILMDAINAREAFLVGAAPNMVIDWVAKLIENKNKRESDY